MREQSTPYFSVVIAAFNAASRIVPTIGSVLNQTYREYEIIVMGDGCTDQTGEVLTANFGDSVQWKNLERNSGGQSYPNNEGIRVALGTHIAYLGHDDIWSPRHLQQLADVIRAQDPDFAVSGAVYHTPPGCRYYQITGVFDDARAAESHFFPPSSFAHRQDVVGRIGFWREPGQLRAPADCEFLLRAVEHKCKFASTKSITVHKFAAGHRYLSYRFPSSTEQVSLLARLSEDGGEQRVLEEIRQDIADGADNPPIRYPNFAASRPGELYRKNRSIKGLEKTASIAVNQLQWLPVDNSPAGLDWYELEQRFRVGPFRWSGPNPNPRYLINIRSAGEVQLAIHLLGFADDRLIDLLKLEVNEREVAFACDRNSTGTYVLTVAPVAVPMEDGLVLRFRLPHCVRMARDPRRRRVGLALSGVEVTPLR